MFETKTTKEKQLNKTCIYQFLNLDLQMYSKCCNLIIISVRVEFICRMSTFDDATR